MKRNNCSIAINLEALRNTYSDLTLGLLWANGATQTKSTCGIDFKEKKFVAEREKECCCEEKGRLPQ